jgi:hypothetical protein
MRGSDSFIIKCVNNGQRGSILLVTTSCILSLSDPIGTSWGNIFFLMCHRHVSTTRFTFFWCGKGMITALISAVQLVSATRCTYVTILQLHAKLQTGVCAKYSPGIVVQFVNKHYPIYTLMQRYILFM